MKLWKNKKQKINAVATGFLTALVCIVVLPLLSGGKRIQYYQIIVGKKAYGCYTSTAEAAKDLNHIRQRLEKTQAAPVMTRVSCSVVPVDKILETSGSVEEDLYETLKDSIEEDLQEAYTIKVNECTITVASQGAVVDTLETVKNTYDTRNCYEIVLETTDSALYLLPVFYPKEGTDMAGMQAMGFEEDVEIIRSYVKPSEVQEPVSAAAALTKEWETPTVYTVVQGDCLSVIAENHNMKTKELAELNMLDNPDEITIGDELVVTVPKPEISVWYEVQAAYEEEYQEETQYIDNEKWYTGTEKVLQEGTTGRHYVVADIRYRGDKEISREILEEIVLEQSQPRIVERGTATPPTYIKPLVGGRFSSPFGSRWGRMHKGIDWACSVGTTIKASSGGTVSSAGWVNGYGYCITISHSDGKKTRYAHLSKILVSSGDKVKQGEKIALSGNTGNSTGPHLHFEILVDGVQVNPLKYLE